jgi:hypothetical protein
LKIQKIKWHGGKAIQYFFLILTDLIVLPNVFWRNLLTPEDKDDFIKSNVCLFEKHDDDIHPDT